MCAKIGEGDDERVEIIDPPAGAAVGVPVRVHGCMRRRWTSTWVFPPPQICCYVGSCSTMVTDVGMHACACTDTDAVDTFKQRKQTGAKKLCPYHFLSIKESAKLIDGGETRLDDYRVKC